MTDTRKEFEGWYLKEYGNDISEYFINDRYLHEMVHMQYMGWQARQSLNDKRIQQLLAVIAKKNEALKLACEMLAYYAEDDTDIENALAMKPSDVELVEVGDTMALPDGTLSDSMFDVTSTEVFQTQTQIKLYTIKTKD